GPDEFGPGNSTRVDANPEIDPDRCRRQPTLDRAWLADECRSRTMKQAGGKAVHWSAIGSKLDQTRRGEFRINDAGAGVGVDEGQSETESKRVKWSSKK